MRGTVENEAVFLMDDCCWHIVRAAAALRGRGGGGGGRAVSDCVHGCIHYRNGPGSTVRFRSCSAGRTSFVGVADYVSLHTVGMQLQPRIKASVSNELSACYITVNCMFVFLLFA